MRKVSVPISKPGNHPIAVHCGPNPAMGAWDVSLMIGNFPSEAEARDAGRRIARLLEREFKVKGSSVQ